MARRRVDLSPRRVTVEFRRILEADAAVRTLVARSATVGGRSAGSDLVSARHTR
jgi:hypothetical protein